MRTVSWAPVVSTINRFHFISIDTEDTGNVIIYNTCTTYVHMHTLHANNINCVNAVSLEPYCCMCQEVQYSRIGEGHFED